MDRLRKPPRITAAFDVAAVLGYCLVAYGLWQWSPAAATIWQGFGLIAFGLLGAYLCRTKDDE